MSDLVRAALAGEATPRPPYAFWTHYPETDLDADAIARETAAFARATRQDFVKSMPNGLYVVEDWGVRTDFSEIAAGGVAKVTASPIQAPEDWARIRRLDPAAGTLGRELRHLSLLVEALGPSVPVLATVFSSVTIAKKVSGGLFAQHARTHPALVRAALDEISATTADFSAARSGSAAPVSSSPCRTRPRHRAKPRGARWASPTTWPRWKVRRPAGSTPCTCMATTSPSTCSPTIRCMS